MIHFFRGEYAWLSNYADCKITIKGIEYQSVENAYMACKNSSPEWKEFCRTKSAAEAKRESKKILLRDNWDEVKLDVMLYCLRQKFAQEPYRTKLIETGQQNIIEGNYWNDTYWGVDLKQDPNWGENHLGRIIMKIRQEIIDEN